MSLDISVPAVKSLLQRARGRFDELDLAEQRPAPPDLEFERALLDRYVAAFEAGDAAGIRAVIHDDFSLEAVPHPVWFKGVHVCVPFLERNAFGRGVRLLPTRANGQPALAAYRSGASGDLGATRTVGALRRRRTLLPRDQVPRPAPRHGRRLPTRLPGTVTPGPGSGAAAC